MAGSMRPSIYITDVLDGVTRKILVLNIDESNARLTGGAAATAANLAGATFANQGADYLRIEPRYLLFEGQTVGGRKVTRRVIACDPANTLFQSGGTAEFIVATGGNTSEVVTMSVSGIVGEKRTMIKALLDTGLDDGTAA